VEAALSVKFGANITVTNAKIEKSKPKPDWKYDSLNGLGIPIMR